jgi:hypothetical protein
MDEAKNRVDRLVGGRRRWKVCLFRKEEGETPYLSQYIFRVEPCRGVAHFK